MTYQDRILTCSDCGQPFTFSADDQAYHAQKGYTNEPKRCLSCRQARKADRGGNSGGARQNMQKFPAVCAQCGKDTEVPFEPRQGRPVYCSSCYSQMRQNQTAK